MNQPIIPSPRRRSIESELATDELPRPVLKGRAHIIDNNRFEELSIADAAIPSLNKRGKTSRRQFTAAFDLAYDGDQLKLLEYNADTRRLARKLPSPNGIGSKSCFPSSISSISIHEKLLAKWQELEPYCGEPGAFRLFRTARR